MSFERALNFVLKWEGGYSLDPDDPGGETNFGISKRAFPDLDIKNLTKEQAGEIYRKKYWNPVKGDELPFPVALALFDFAVNSGVGRAVTTLQKQVGAIVDGDFGPNTLAKVNELISFKSINDVAVELCSLRAEFLYYIIRGRPTSMKYLKGWLRRIFSLIMEII